MAWLLMRAMESAKSPRQLLQALCAALCAAWRRYVALPHERANMDDLRIIDAEILRMPPDSLLASKGSRSTMRDSPRYYLLLGQLILDADGAGIRRAGSYCATRNIRRLQRYCRAIDPRTHNVRAAQRFDDGACLPGPGLGPCLAARITSIQACCDCTRCQWSCPASVPRQHPTKRPSPVLPPHAVCIWPDCRQAGNKRPRVCMRRVYGAGDHHR